MTVNTWKFVALYLLVLSLGLVGPAHWVAMLTSAACLLAGLIPGRVGAADEDDLERRG